MKKLAFTLLAVAGFLGAATAQSDFRPGTIVKLSGDTLRCSIDFRGDMSNGWRCIYRGTDGTQGIYLPADIAEYWFDGGKHYISKNIRQKDTTLRLFAEYVVKGRKSVYYLRNSGGFHYFIDCSRDTLMEIPYSCSLEQEDGRTYQRETKIHQGLLRAYFSDCPTIFGEIDGIRKPSFDNLIKVTKEYHDITCGPNSCVVYTKPKIATKLSIEPMFGLEYFTREKVHLWKTGAFVHFWLPRADERLYAKTGFVYYMNSTKVDSVGNGGMFNIPIRFEYMLPGSRIQPKFDAGFNWIWEKDKSVYGMGLSLAASAGIAVKLTPHVYFDLEVDSDLLGMALDSDIALLTVGGSCGLRISF